MDFELQGRRALICGASQGIGRAIAREFAHQGAHVTLVGRSRPSLESVLQELEGSGHGILVADFSRPRELKRLIVGIQVHLLVNNSGGPPHGALLDADLETFESAFAQHILCNQVLAQQLVPYMRECGYGRIVNIVSTSVRQPIPGLGVSNTIRAAVAGWAKTLSDEVAPFGITVNNVLPGSTDTSHIHDLYRHIAESSGRSETEVRTESIAKIPMRRLATPQEIAQAVCFLASPAASYITGVSLPVDGGKIRSI